MSVARRFAMMIVALLLLAGCASTAQIAPQGGGPEVCLGGVCGPAEGRIGRDELLGGLVTLFKANERITHEFCQIDDKTGACGKKSLGFFVQGGPIPAPGSLSNPIFDDVYLDWKSHTVGFRMDADILWVGPVLCGDSATTVTVDENANVLLDAGFACTWTMFPTFWDFKLAVDRIDFDNSVLSGRYSMGGGGLLNAGGGSGKFRFSLANAGTLGAAPRLIAASDLPGSFLVSLAPTPEEGAAPPPPPKPAPKPKPVPKAEPAPEPKPAPQPAPAPEPKPEPVDMSETVAPVISAPKRLEADGPVVDIGGRVDDASAVVEFAVDGVPTLLAADGAFALRRAVPIGVTTVRLAAVDEWGNKAAHEVRIDRAPPPQAAKAAAADTTAPVIEVPATVASDDRAVEFSGRVRDASPIFELRADGASIPVGRDGGFTVRRQVPIGETKVVLGAVDKWGNKAERTVTVRRTEPRSTARDTGAGPDVTPPVIVIPPKVFTATIEARITGHVVSDSALYALTIDGRPVTPGPDGAFAEKRYVPLGTTEMAVVAIDVWGNKTETSLFVERAAEVVETVSLPPLDPTRIKARPRPDTVALIIGVAGYRAAPRADYADRDARVFYDYAVNALGVPADKVKVLTEDQADALSIFKTVDLWVKANVSRGTGEVIVFFAGHGLASPDGEELFLLPFDGDPNYVERTAIRRGELIEALTRSGAKSVTLLLDTCYSGVGRGGETLLAGARPILLRAKEQATPPGVTVLTAAAGDEISSGLPRLQHGLFSYFVMRGLEGEADKPPFGNGDRALTLGELRAYLLDAVGRQAAELGRSQTPTLQGDPTQVLARW